jgi:hypothetical protein
MWFTPEMAAAYSASQGVVSGTADTTDPNWRLWQQTMREYTEAASAEGFPKSHFWIVIALPGGNYANHLDWHHEIPMLMPASGTGKFLGIALTKPDLDQMVEKDKDNVHLTFKVKIQGQSAWRELLEFLARHDMLENENS